MPTQTLPTRTRTPRAASLPRSFAVAFLLHVGVLGTVLGWTLIHYRGKRWGDQNPLAGSIQASMVDSLPLPPRQPVVDKAVLASDKPSIAPTPPPPTPAPPKAKAEPTPPKTVPPPKPHEVLIPTKAPPPKPTMKEADRSQPDLPKRAATPPPPTPKATTGESAGIQIPQSVTQLKNGTASITVEERSFGDRYAYYIRLISQKVNQNWSQGGADAHASDGKHATIIFTIDRDGTPVDAHIGTRSGSPSLDTAALRTIQRIDTFGPLPQGDHITIEFSFDFRAL